MKTIFSNAKKGKRRIRGMGGRMPRVSLEVDNYKDRIARAWAREREHRSRPWLMPECETVWAHVFRCVCCGRMRDEQERREPGSEVCMRCVGEAGYLN